jgi:hypothetical protein
MCCQFSDGVSIPILCPLALPNKAVGLESQIGSWLASHFKPTFLLAKLHEPRASNHHRCMKPSRQSPQLACSRSRSARHAHSPGAIEVGLDASQTPSSHRGAGGGVSLDTPLIGYWLTVIRPERFTGLNFTRPTNSLAHSKYTS